MSRYMRILQALEDDKDLTKLWLKIGGTFRTNAAPDGFLQSVAVSPYFEEYCEKFLMAHPDADEPNYNEVTRYHAQFTGSMFEFTKKRT
ncbi:Uu.00g097760.m01.CDS01 [Anthostomella pinea]|uniref:Uu.00g097760.m01.CDS01 n=1 Tax=Anthostomella pinea TaxID=933095 RepID=A0AAI8YF31_9PEZI|nr:Uu.00g097760.m01.CDS01 [Anthostomella pinea]